MKIEGGLLFDSFVEAYPLHRRNTKKRDALKAWNSVEGDKNSVMILALLKKRLQEWRGRKPEFVPHMSSFLRSEDFDDYDFTPNEFEAPLLAGEIDPAAQLRKARDDHDDYHLKQGGDYEPCGECERWVK